MNCTYPIACYKMSIIRMYYFLHTLGREIFIIIIIFNLHVITISSVTRRSVQVCYIWTLVCEYVLYQYNAVRYAVVIHVDCSFHK